MRFLILLLPLLVFADPVINAATTVAQRYEGFRSTAYVDAHGLSIGYGTNLTAGISEEEALVLLQFRLIRLNRQLSKLEWFNSLTPFRKVAILDLAYNIGYAGLLQFKDMIWCLKHGYYNGAANRMKRSLWYKQTGRRARYLVQLMRQG